MVPCSSIENYERSPFVFWRNLTLEPNKVIRIEKEQVDGKMVNVEKRYEPASSFMEDYFETLVELIRYYFPNDDLMKVTSALNQAKWPYNVDKILTTEHIYEGLKSWPSVMQLEDEIPDMTEDINHLISVLKGPTVNWCQIYQSKPTHFWNLLLVKGVLTPNLKKLVERTITMPYGSSDAERAFR